METNERTRIGELEAEVAELRRLVERLVEPRGMATDRGSGDPAPAAPPLVATRRRMLRLVGAAAFGAAGAAASTRAVAADTGFTVAGSVTTTSDVIRNVYDGSVSTSTSFVFGAGNWSSNASLHPAALGGWSDGLTGRPANGIYGYTAANNASGVVGRASPATSTGVYGLSVNGTGVKADGYTGLVATGLDTGVKATGTTAHGVYATGSIAGVSGLSTTGYALSGLVGGRASLYLQPNNNNPTTSTTAAKVPVQQRTDVHQAGEVESIDGDLWFCVASGTPGTWRKLTGLAAGGAFHPFPPTRVYDSRNSGTGGPLVASTNRTVSVKDGLDVTTGAVRYPDVVPAGATAITANVTVVGTAGAGFLAVNPGGATVVEAATVNWYTDGQVLNNGVNLTLDANRRLTVIAGGSTGAQADFVIDVTGYYL